MTLKVKSACKITSYIKSHNKDLYEVIEFLCLHGIFRPKGTAGITFMMPNAAVCKQIINAAYSNDPEPAENMLRALTFIDYLPTPDSFIKKKDDLPNQLGHHVPLDDKKSSNKKIVFECGAEAVPAPFKPYKYENIAIYDLKGKLIPLKGPSAKRKYCLAKKGGAVYGGFFGDSRLDCDLKFTAHQFEKVENNISMEIAAKAVCSFLHFCAKNKDESGALEALEIAGSIWCWTPQAMFYILFEPFRKGSRMLNSSLVKKWLKKYKSGDFKFGSGYGQTYINYGNALLESAGEQKIDVVAADNDATVRGGKDGKRDAMDANDLKQLVELRETIVDNRGSKATLIKEIERAYSKMRSQNKINDKTIWSHKVKNLLDLNRLWGQHEICFMVERALQMGGDAFQEFAREHAEFMFSGDKPYLKSIGVKYMSRSIFYDLARSFARSSFFLYVPAKSNIASGNSGVSTYSADNISSHKSIDMVSQAIARVSGSNSADDTVKSNLNA